MDKAQLRNDMIASLKALSSQEKIEIEKRLTDHLLNSSIWAEANTIGVTMSQGFEWDTRKIIETGWEQGKTIAAPKCYPSDKSMIFYQINHYDQLEKVYYDLLEPKPEETVEIPKTHLDLIIVPGVLYEQKGYRIGFGGGYYDRFLADFPNKTVSLVSTLQLKESLPTDPYDIPVQHIITENGHYK
ncbi:5-formyltetrahydrofolate cyclo-ligase [Niallia sp. XMNu-256]|uniref:5-formyltetrahydrofolate cyclo-ligase n=1 Tax=Niallia sp. XMNu-256 TaxID=3082444 RepID=UPI0030CED7A1